MRFILTPSVSYLHASSFILKLGCHSKAVVTVAHFTCFHPYTYLQYMYTGVQLLLLVLTISVTAAAATAALSTETHHQHHQRHQQQQQQQSYDQHLQISWPFPRPPVDAVGNVQRLANCLYIQNNLSCVDEYCQQSVVTHVSRECCIWPFKLLPPDIGTQCLVVMLEICMSMLPPR